MTKRQFRDAFMTPIHGVMSKEEISDIAADLFEEVTRCQACGGKGGDGKLRITELAYETCFECNGTGSRLR